MGYRLLDPMHAPEAAFREDSAASELLLITDL